MPSESETLNSHFTPSAPPHLPATKSSQPMAPTAKSSNWLHRLRSSRGFPDSDHINLEHFLLSTSQNKINNSTTDSSLEIKSTPLLQTAKRDDDNRPVQEQEQDLLLIDNLLSDLFYMGDCNNQSTKKSCRKQTCPRICIVSSNFLDKKQSTGSTSPLTFSGRRSNKGKEVNEMMERVEVEVEEEEEKERWDVSGYSQTEVTVIDTSVPCWKFEKVLYRSKNVWRVGDRKGKGLMSGDGDGDGKKRKEKVSESGGDAPKKKLKKKLRLSSSSKNADKGESVVLPKKSVQGHEQGKMVAGNEKKRDNCNQVQEKSFGKKQIDEGSSVILIKSIPTTNKKNVSGASSSCVKSIQR